MRSAAVLVGTLLLAATGCGTSTPHADPDVRPASAARPTWGGCVEHSQMSIDYAAGARGEPTLTDALAPYREPGDHVVKRPRQPHRNAAWLLVDERNVIHAALGAWHTHDGWLVDSVERCAD